MIVTNTKYKIICAIFYLSIYLDIFDGSCGMYALLDRECILQNPSTDNFIRDFVTPLNNNIVRLTQNSDKFLVRHFAQNVVYTAVRFNHD